MQGCPMVAEAEFPAPIAREIWDLKYRLKGADGAAIDCVLTSVQAQGAGASARGGGRPSQSPARQ